MIYLTQLLFVKEGEEEALLEFEETALSVMHRHGGRLLYRVKPPAEAFVHAEGEVPYEIHVVSFASRQQLEGFLADEERQRVAHLKERSIKSTIVIEGQRW